MSRTSRKSLNDPVAGSSLRESTMIELFISREGRGYGYNGYHYGRLSDAVDYARLMLARPGQPNVTGPGLHVDPPHLPGDAERERMARLGIDLDDGRYRFEGYRYDRLDDAVHYAELQARRRGRPAP